jgi:hypothetical protein
MVIIVIPATMMVMMMVASLVPKRLGGGGKGTGNLKEIASAVLFQEYSDDDYDPMRTLTKMRRGLRIAVVTRG